MRATTLTAFLLLAALAGSTAAVAQQTGGIVLHVADTALLRQEAQAGRFATAKVGRAPEFRLLAADNLLEIRPGTYPITVTLRGYRTFRDTVEVPAGTRVRVAVRFVPDSTLLAGQNPDSLDPLRRAVAATRPLTMVRVELRGGQRVSGAFARSTPTALELSDSAGLRTQLAYADASRYWVRGRAVGPGAIVGGVIGAGVGVFFGLLASGMCEYDCPSSGGAVAAGALFVGAVGTAAGAIVGAAFPQWKLRWSSTAAAPRDSLPRPAPVPVAAAPTPRDTAPAPAVRTPTPQAAAPAAPKARQTGEMTLQIVGAYSGTEGYTSGSYVSPDTYQTAIGGAASLGFRYRRAAFGPSILLLSGSSGTRVIDGLARLDLVGAGARAAPYAALGMGAYRWSTDELYLGASLGAGVTFGSHRQWRAEARWHTTVQNTGTSTKPSMFSISAGRRFAW